MKHTHAHAIVEIAHAAEKTADALEKTHSAVSKGSRVMQAISVTQAFRKYKWLSATPELNNAGNFRGMVVSARWRSVYQISTNVHHAAERTEKAAKNLGAFATFAGALISVSGELEDTYRTRPTSP